jgi:hypothetical protein
MQPPKKTLTINKVITVDLEQVEQEVLRRFVNIAHTGSAEVNHYEGDRLVSRFPEKDAVLVEAHRSIARSNKARLHLTYDEDGNLVRVQGWAMR